ncbi:MAG: DUF2207 domain-containing protein [Clostridia bacterium]|nr:DUF2207 domain-containing protein [Clostridia bacterium]MBP3681631.1 DUF2207 domain-containing protein [Clostridia bacterium]
MKKVLKKIVFISVFLTIAFFTSNIYVDANTINSITMDIFLNKDGSGHVTEVWDMNLNEGTEAYKPYGNLKNYKIKNFSVKDETGKVYETIHNWNTKASFSSKAYKCGILTTYNGVELCWGMSQYGDKTYTLEYDIEGLVQQLNDAQTIYFSFMPEDMNPSPKSVKITIDSDTEFTEENAKIWAYGYDGEINFENSNIVMDSDGRLYPSEYMVALVKFEENIFSPTVELNKVFSSLQLEAMQGSDYNLDEDIDNEDKNVGIGEMLGIIPKMFGTVFFMMISFATGPLFVVAIFGFVLYEAAKPKEGSLNFGTKGRVLPNQRDINYYRDIPCDGSIYKGYFLVDNYISTVKRNDSRSGLMGAIFLRWIKDKRVTIVKTKGGILDFGRNEFALDITMLMPSDDLVEEKLIYMLREAAGANEILESKEFEKWCYANYRKIDNWFEYATTQAIKEYVAEGAIVERETQVKSIFGNKIIKQNFVNPEVKQDAINLYGLRKYLSDYSLIHERQAIEVMLWEEYLIFAQILGIADKVEDEFKKLYPDFSFIEDLEINEINSCIRIISHNGVYAAERAYRAAHASSGSSSGSRSRSSGGGGRSSRGGGRSSGGSSRGGGTR